MFGVICREIAESVKIAFLWNVIPRSLVDK
jgi:hypothetical protein